MNWDQQGERDRDLEHESRVDSESWNNDGEAETLEANKVATATATN